MGHLGFKFMGVNKNGTDCECNSVLVEDGPEESLLNKNENRCQDHSNKKMTYFVFFISTSVIVCFCIFFIIPQLIDHYAEENEIGTNFDQKHTVIELLAEESRKQERLDILEKFDILQKNYKILQAQYEKAKESYLTKLHGSYGV